MTSIKQESALTLHKKSFRLILTLFIIGAVLRLGFASANYVSNDNHMEVIQVIINENRVPVGRELWEAFQPKFYHLTVATVLKALPEMTEKTQTKVAQFVSASAGVVTLLLLWSYLNKFIMVEWARTMAFGLAALNPRLISISGQATNDAFVILWASAAIFCARSFFGQPGLKTFLPLLITCILAAISKGNGLVVSIALAVTLTILAILGGKNVHLSKNYALRYLIVFLTVFMFTAPILGGYLNNYKIMGSSMAINWEGSYPLPNLITETYHGRPGITSLAHGYLTFRFANLLMNPIMTKDKKGYSAHRTSYWSQIYAQTFYAHYTGPAPWISKSGPVVWMGRVVYTLALIPALLLLCGVLSGWWQALLTTFSLRPADFYEIGLFNAICSAGYIGFGITYSFIYRDISVIKVIFCFPALFIFVVYGAGILDGIYKKKNSLLNLLTTCSLIFLYIVHGLDIILLINRLIINSYLF